MADLADTAYAHATAVLGAAGAAAADAAIEGLRRGGRSRVGVLGHTRAAALSRTSDPAGFDAAPAPTVAADAPLLSVALALAGTRPAGERALVDLDGRHGLNRGQLGHALGVLPAEAAGAMTRVAAAWQADLDPALMAHLGPAGCDGLAAALTGAGVPPPEDAGNPPRPPAGIDTLLAAGAAARAHAEDCDTCRDRLRAMVSVRALLAQRPIERAPDEVRVTARGSRPRRPLPLPAAETAVTERRRPRWVAAAAAGAVVALAVGLALLVTRPPGGDTRVDELTRVGGGPVLAVSPDAVTGPVPGVVTLRNDGPRRVTWRAVPDAKWILPLPTEGTLDPGATVRVHLSIGPSAPEGEVRGTLTFAGDGGESAVVRVTSAIERPPDLSASAEGCTASAAVEDESEIAAVLLHWRERSGPNGTTVEKTAPMAPSAPGDGYAGRLPAEPYPLSWWVSAVDARGNLAKTTEQVAAPGSCTTPG